jgi:Family of unknown function (DUF5808)
MNRTPKLRHIANALGMGLLALAVIQELRKPREARTWHGSILGAIPYDLRVPTAARFRERLWAPDDSRVFMPQVFGVGWTINIGRVAALLRRRG